MLAEIQDAIAAVVERVGPSTVGIGRGWGRGSGVVVAHGRILTAAHAVRGAEIAVRVGGGEATTATVAGVDGDLGLAVLEADTGDAPAVAWEPERGAGLVIGAPVLAVADPGGRGLRATLGFVASTGRSFRGPHGRRVRDLVEHTAPLPRGSSGSPLLDPEGRLLGVNVVRTDGGLILAITADASLKARVDALARGEHRERRRLGLALAHARAARRLRAAVGLPERDGLLVRAVQDDSPAGRAGIQRGDLLVAAAGAPLATLDDLLAAIDAAPDSLELTVVRGLDERTVTVVF